jgi:hypothetical protein
MKQKKLIQKYNQKRLREEQKLKEQQQKVMYEQLKYQGENPAQALWTK